MFDGADNQQHKGNSQCLKWIYKYLPPSWNKLMTSRPQKVSAKMKIYSPRVIIHEFIMDINKLGSIL